jgi:hypothetical protein
VDWQRNLRVWLDLQSSERLLLSMPVGKCGIEAGNAPFDTGIMDGCMGRTGSFLYIFSCLAWIQTHTSQCKAIDFQCSFLVGIFGEEILGRDPQLAPLWKGSIRRCWNQLTLLLFVSLISTLSQHKN